MTTLALQIEGWLKANQSVWKLSTRIKYRDVLEDHVIPMLGKRGLRSLVKRDFEMLREDMNARNLSSSIINSTLSTLNSVMVDAVDNGFIKSNPMQSVKRVKQGLVKDIVPLTREEIQSVIEAVEPEHYRPFYITMAWTGMRPNELIALRWYCIDFKKETISIKSGIVCGAEDLPKTKNSIRTILLPPQAAAALANHPRHSDFVFAEKDGTPMHAMQVSTVWKRACGRAGVRYQKSYNLRHALATWELENGMKLSYVSAKLGHANANVTAERYLKYTPTASDDRTLKNLMQQHQ